MAGPGLNWHQVVGGSAIPLNSGLTLTRATGFNILWLCTDSANNNTVYIGFNSNVTVPSRGTPSATDGWPLAAGKTLPFLIGENFDCGASVFGIAGAAGQDLYVIGY